MMLKNSRRRFVLAAALTTLFATAAGCMEVDSLPTKPNEPGIVLKTHVSDWREEVIYQLLTDRFYDADVNNNYNVDVRSMSRYHGGDWRGIIEKLDYLQELGVTTLWISPVVKNVEEDAGFASYHGYWTQDFIKHNPHYGDLHDLRALSDALHERGMKLILDIVTNHVGQAFFYDVNMNGQPDEYLSGYGYAMQGSGWAGGSVVSNMSRVTEYDPDWEACGVQAFTSLGLAGQAPVIFFNNPSNNRVPPGPQNIDLNGDGVISGEIEELGFSNPDWYHKRGRVSDWDKQYDNGEVVRQPPYEHRMTNADGTYGSYIDGTARKYYQNDQTLLADFPGGLKDVATERDDVRRAMIQAFSYWIDVTDCDGFRIDTLKHVEYSFWETFAPAIRAHAKSRGKSNFFMYGEAFDGNDNLLAAYTQPNQVDSVFLFSQKYAIDQAFKCAPGNQSVYCKGQSNGTAVLYGWDSNGVNENRIEKFSATPQPNGVTDAQGQGLAPRQVLVNFLDNHDVGRYLFDRSDEKGIDSLKNALSFLFTTNGIPCLYYGTEQGFFGGNDPSNREDMGNPAASIYSHNNYGYNYSPWNTDNPIFKHIQNLIKIRKSVPALSKGSYTVDWYSKATGSEDEAGIFAYHRTYNNQSVVVVVNTHESATKMTRGNTGGGLPTPFGSNTQLVDLLDSSFSLSTDGSGAAVVSVPPMTTRILVKAADKSSYNL